MPIKCPSGTKEMYRYKKKKTKSGKKVRLGGCGKKGKFVSIKEVKLFGGETNV